MAELRFLVIPYTIRQIGSGVSITRKNPFLDTTFRCILQIRLARKIIIASFATSAG